MYESDVHLVVKFGVVVCYVRAVIAVLAEVVVVAVEVVLVVVVVGYGCVVILVGRNFEMVAEFDGLVAVGVAWILALVQKCF